VLCIISMTFEWCANLYHLGLQSEVLCIMINCTPIQNLQMPSTIFFVTVYYGLHGSSWGATLLTIRHQYSSLSFTPPTPPMRSPSQSPKAATAPSHCLYSFLEALRPIKGLLLIGQSFQRYRAQRSALTSPAARLSSVD
jgi:hypothetical protein